MLAIILTSYHDTKNLSQLCDQFLQRKFEVGVVLSGQESDLVLRDHGKLAECDLVYDTTVEHNWISNFQSGLYLASNPCILVPADWNFDNAAINELLQYSQTTLKLHLIKPSQSEWPVMITRMGLKHVRALDDLNSLTDVRIKQAVASKALLEAHYNNWTQSGKNESEDTFTDLEKSL
jgi:hypothetical protein